MLRTGRNHSKRVVWCTFSPRVSYESVAHGCPTQQCPTRAYPTRVSWKSVPQDRPTECPTRVSHRVSHKTVPQECPRRVPTEHPTRVSHKSVPKEFPTRVSQKITSLTRVCRKSALKVESPTVVFHKCVLQTFPARVPHKARVSHKSVSDKSVNQCVAVCIRLRVCILACWLHIVTLKKLCVLQTTMNRMMSWFLGLPSFKGLQTSLGFLTMLHSLTKIAVTKRSVCHSALCGDICLELMIHDSIDVFVQQRAVR